MQAPLAPQFALLSMSVQAALHTPLTGSHTQSTSPEHSAEVEYFAEQRWTHPDEVSWHVCSLPHVAVLRMTQDGTHLAAVAEK
jgi:hypothetical protein